MCWFKDRLDRPTYVSGAVPLRLRIVSFPCWRHGLFSRFSTRILRPFLIVLATSVPPAHNPVPLTTNRCSQPKGRRSLLASSKFAIQSRIMSEYTSTIEGFQRAMKWSLTGPPQEAKAYVEALSTPTFYQIMNGQCLSYDVYLKGIEEWRGKISDYHPVVYVKHCLIFYN